MKTIEVEPHIRKTLATLDAEIKVRQDELGQLLQCRNTLCELNEIPISLPLGNVTAVQTARSGKLPPTKEAKKREAYKSRKGGGKATPLSVLRHPAPVAQSTQAIIDGKSAPTGRDVVRWNGPASEKPTTMGAAMKWIGKQLAPVFTRAEIKAAIEADADWSKLHGQQPTAFSGNLIYWSQSGKLKRTGEKETEQFHVINLDF